VDVPSGNVDGSVARLKGQPMLEEQRLEIAPLRTLIGTMTESATKSATSFS